MVYLNSRHWQVPPVRRKHPHGRIIITHALHCKSTPFRECCPEETYCFSHNHYANMLNITSNATIRITSKAASPELASGMLVLPLGNKPFRELNTSSYITKFKQAESLYSYSLNSNTPSPLSSAAIPPARRKGPCYKLTFHCTLPYKFHYRNTTLHFTLLAGPFCG